MSNTSATGGYLGPTTSGLPGGLTLNQFIQTVIVGISGIAGTAVRPRWQPEPPNQPDNPTNWIAFGISQAPADTYAFVGMDSIGAQNLKRQEYLTVLCSFYGPLAYENMGILRDGLQVTQNLAALTAAKMGFIETNGSVRAPEFINGRWIDRYDMNMILVREIQRTYQVLPFLSAEGTILTDQSLSLDWLVEE